MINDFSTWHLCIWNWNMELKRFLHMSNCVIAEIHRLSLLVPVDFVNPDSSKHGTFVVVAKIYDLSFEHFS